MRRFENEYTREISFPLGGIGTGSIGIGGNGRFLDWEIFNRPDKGSMNGYSNFSVRAIDKNGNIIARALCGDIVKDYMGQYQKKRFTGYGFGVSGYTMAGFPHFEDQSFECRFPFAYLNFSSADFPARITLKAFNPFIPLDEDDSSIPAAFFELEFENISDREYIFSGALSVNRPFPGKNSETELCGAKGVFMQSDAPDTSVNHRDMTVLCEGGDTYVQPYWYRGAWQDTIVTFWRELSQNRRFLRRVYDDTAKSDHCTVCADIAIPAGEKRTLRYIIAWNAPNCINFWKPVKDENGNDVMWKNYYATLWENSKATAAYSMQNWESLKARSEAFTEAVYSTDIDEALLETAVANLSTLKSPTVLRLEDGTVWAWEGVHEGEGSCPGTCSHVWNYAYAIPFLFPRLERRMREVDFRYNQFENGMMAFRQKLPLGYVEGDPRPCLDGQMGAVIKTYREWKLSGDTEWLRSIWQSVKKALEYAWIDDNISSWDADRDGVLEGRQHHTLDMELFGPSAWLEGFYIAALRAASEMADALGYTSDAEIYRELAKRGYEWTRENLFNGEYYVQKVDLHDKKQLEKFGVEDKYWNAETGEIKYQIAEGCEIDQLVAQWHASVCGIGDIFDKEQRRTALRSLYKNNHKTSMRDFANPWRVFALNDESGTVMCDYPVGVQKPAVPLPYTEECMSGFEYALGALMLAEGMEEEGKSVVRSVYDRYNGKNRNPYAEIECGSNYARGMASWSFIPIMSGFECDMVKKRIGFKPLGGRETLASFWSCDKAWGTVRLGKESFCLNVTEGELELKTLLLGTDRDIKSVVCDEKDMLFEAENGVVSFADGIAVGRTLAIEFI